MKDTIHYINKIESREYPHDVLLIIYDVNSVFTNKEFDELSSAE